MFVPADLVPRFNLQFTEEDHKALEMAKQIDLDERQTYKTFEQESQELFEAFKLNQSLLAQVENRIREDHKFGVRDSNAINHRESILKTIEDLRTSRKKLEERKKGKDYILEKIHEHLKEIKLLQMELEKIEK
jgi:hypothetical protein